MASVKVFIWKDIDAYMGLEHCAEFFSSDGVTIETVLNDSGQVMITENTPKGNYLHIFPNTVVVKVFES